MQAVAPTYRDYSPFSLLFPFCFLPLTVSLFGIQGEDGEDVLALDNLIAVAERTNGTVNIVDALEMQRQMRLVLDNPVVGTLLSHASEAICSSHLTRVPLIPLAGRVQPRR